jgi:hypothetical protein
LMGVVVSKSRPSICAAFKIAYSEEFVGEPPRFREVSEAVV